MRPALPPLCAPCRHNLLFPRRRSHPNSYRKQSTTSTSSSPRHPLKLAIIGSGPSGFYSASRILSLLPATSDKGKDVEIHMYERLPTPYGLVRYGVAPDHPEVKNCQHKFDELSSDPRFKYVGNTSIGTQASSSSSSPSPSTTLSSYTYPHALHLPLSCLLPHYSSILFTYGASLSNPLSSIAGSSSSLSPLEEVYPALALVGWYNGHPAFSHLTPDLRNTQDVTIIGHGNVALDVARILLKDVGQLKGTDIPTKVLDVLGESRVKRVSAVGRRGPAQVAFTTKEFREMLHLPGVEYAGLSPNLVQGAKGMVEGDRMRTRLLGLMENPSQQRGSKEFKMDFLRSPSAFVAGDSGKRVASVVWNINELLAPVRTPDPPMSQGPSVPSPGPAMVRPTGERLTTTSDMVVESVGYRAEGLGVREGWALPFDDGRGRVRNVSGRVTDEQGVAIAGMYAAGWVARGPVGVIASTMHDAYALAEQIIDDHLSGPANAGIPLSPSPGPGLPAEVKAGLRDGRVVDLEGWRRIDEAERERGRAKGKEREKFVRVEDMLAVLG